MKKSFIYFLCLLAIIAVFTSCDEQKQEQEAKKELIIGNWVTTADNYEELLKQGPSVELYYNLGNAYFRTDNITRAVLNYERALLLSPGDDDIKFNLQMARSKTIDKITPKSEMFFIVTTISSAYETNRAPIYTLEGRYSPISLRRRSKIERIPSIGIATIVQAAATISVCTGAEPKTIPTIHPKARTQDAKIFTPLLSMS